MATYTVTLTNAAGTEITSGDYYVTPVARGALASSSETLKGDGSSDGTIKVSIDSTLSYLTLYVHAATAETTDDVTTYEPTGDVLGTSGLLTNSTSGGSVTIQLDSVKSSERGSLSGSLSGIATTSDLAALISADALDLTSLALVASESGDSPEVLAAQAAAAVLADELSSAFSSALGTTTTLADSLDEILYGLIRQGQPTTAALLLSQPAAQLEDALNAAIEAGQIDSDLSDQVSTITTALRQTMAWLVQEDGSSPLWTVLGYTSLSDAQKTAFLAEWLTRTDDDATFWDGLTTTVETLTAEQVDELKRVLGLSTITGGDAGLVGKLLKDGIEEAADLVAWTTSEWETRLQSYLDTLDVDSDDNGTLDASSFSLPVDDAEAETTLSVAEYAAHLAGQVEAAFPSSRLRAAVATRGTLSVPDTFDFETDSARDADAGVSEDAVAGVESLQRAFNASPDEDRAEIVLRLTDAGFNSANHVARMGRRAFASRHTETFKLDSDADDTSGATRARQTWSRGRAQSAQAQALHALFSPDFTGARPAAVPGVSTVALDGLDTSSAPAGQRRLKANFSAVFASRRSSTKRGALSAFSPAAYLVDILAWLKTCENSDGTSAYDVLVARRPDIPAVQLSEANTTRTLPALDLVLEVLEAAVSEEGLSSMSAATTGATDDLLAYPEHLNPEAYNADLQTAALPPHLPFHLWQEQGRVYLEHLGVARHELMRQLQSGLTDTDIAAETLGLCPAAWQLIAAPAETGKEALRWGYAEGDDTSGWTATLCRARALMEALGVDYPTLRDMVGADFVDPDGVATLTDDDHEDGPLFTVSDGAEATLAALLDRLQRFARLRAAVPWTVSELDHAIKVADSPMGADGVSDASLTFLAHLLRLERALDVPGPRLLGLWGALDIRTPRKTPDLPSPYQAVFASRSIPRKSVNPLDIDADKGELVEPVEEGDTVPDDVIAKTLLGANLEAIRASLDITEAERLALIRDPDIGSGEETAPYGSLRPAPLGRSDIRTLENLGQLHGLVTLARALKLSTVELAALRNTFDANPTDGPDHTWEFVREVRRLRKAGISVDELMYVVHCESYAQDRVGLRSDDLSERMDALLEAVQQAREDWEALVAQTKASAGADGENLARVRLALGLTVAAEDLEPLLGLLGQDALSTADMAEIREVLTDLVSNITLNDLDSATPETRYQSIADELLPAILEDRCARIATERISDLIGLPYEQAEALAEADGVVVDALIDESIYAEEPDEEAVDTLLQDAAARLLRLHRLALLARKLKLDREELGWLLDNTERFGLIGVGTLATEEATLDDEEGRAAGQARYKAWRNTLDLFALGRRVPGHEPARVDLLTALAEDVDEAGTLPEVFFAALHARAGWSTEVMGGLAEALSMSSASFADAASLVRWLDALSSALKLGVDADQVVSLTEAELDEDAALIAVHAARARLGEAGWKQAGRPLRDRLRVRQRDALVAYLLHDKGLDRPMDLSKQLLVDVEVGPEPLTSRLVAATSAVQAFVLRALLNLESEVQLSREEAEQWEWRSRYRMWEANRKVFFYPENWLEPELRDDKSELFEALESELLQGELSDVTVERAFERYLEGLAGVANLLVLSHYHEVEDDEDGTVDILHVFARTRSNPPVYYYRQWVDQSRWTAWEKLDVGVEGDHLVPVVFNRRLMLFWATFVAQADSSGTTSWWEIQLAYSERREERWSPKAMVDAKLATNPEECDYVDPQDDADTWSSDNTRWPLKGTSARYTIRSWFSGDDLILSVFWQDWTYMAVHGDEDDCTYQDGAEVGRFVFAAGELKPEIEAGSLSAHAMYPGGCFTQAMRYGSSWWSVSGTSTLTIPNALQDLDDGPVDGTESGVTLLGSMKAPFSITPDHSSRYFLGQVPFFFQDNAGSYFFVPEDVSSSSVLKRRFSTGRFNVMGANLQAPSSVRLSVGQSVQTSLLETAEVSLAAATESVAISGLATSDFTYLSMDLTSKYAYMFEASAMATSSTMPVKTRVGAASTIGASVGAASMLRTSDTSTAVTLTASRAVRAARVLAGPTVSVSDLLFRAEHNYQYQVYRVDHPYTSTLLKVLRRDGVFGLLNPDEDSQNKDLCRQQISADTFKLTYSPSATSVLSPYPKAEIDFAADGACSLYNWELFFHAPLLIAERLRREQKFAEARQWYHCIFDPTDRSTTDSSDTSRYWKVKPLYESSLAGVDTLLGLYSDDSGMVARTQRQLDAQLAVWREDPFDPHAIARLRVAAYQKSVVMKYIDNIIDWADHLFRQDTLESVNEATTLYLLAAELLGDRPILAADEEPETDPPTVQDVLDELDDADGTAGLSDPLIRAENLLPRTLRAANLSEKVGLPLSAIPTAFSVPHNAHLLSYWTKVEDRLFKVRHSQNIEGMTRTLSLFAPPIDPALLVRARAMGVDLSSAIAELEAPLPPYKFQSVLQQAQALAGTVKALGGALLAALEKRDGEALSLLRGGQEQALLKAVREVKEKAIEEAERNIEGLEKNKAGVEWRRDYFAAQIEEGQLESEENQMGSIKWAIGLSAAASAVEGVAGALFAAAAIAPDVEGPVLRMQQAATGLQAGGTAISLSAGLLRGRSEILGIKATYARRKWEWKHQKGAANIELKAIAKQLLAAEVRKSIAERDLKNHDLQMEHAETIDTFMRSKFTNQQLYDWTVTQLSGLYFQSYRLAVDMARKAERCFRYELGQQSAAYIQYGHWDSLRKGLLAGERLQLDLDRMSAAWTEQHRRENEITKHISLALLDASALQQLRLAGSCEIVLPEALFDQDFPGHYFRRIRSVSVTIPCVAGPYGGLNATLTLVSSKVRTSTEVGTSYVESETGSDSRFQYLYGSQSVALSSGQNDAGVFELSLQDPRYLPFEGAGAVGTWKLELEGAVQLFDWQSISDVVMHLRYTSRASATLKSAAIATVKSLWADAAKDGLVLGLSARTDFSDAWYRFLHPSADATEAKLEIAVAQTRFPRPLQSATLSIQKIELIQVTPTGEEVSGLVSALSYGDTDLGSPAWDATTYEMPAATLTPESALETGGTLTLSAATGVASEDNLTDLVVLVYYTAEVSE